MCKKHSPKEHNKEKPRCPGCLKKENLLLEEIRALYKELRERGNYIIIPVQKE